MQTKYNVLNNLHDNIRNVLADSKQFDTRFLSDDSRNSVVNSLVESIQTNDSITMDMILYDGFKGYTNYTDLELITDVLTYFPTNDEDIVQDSVLSDMSKFISNRIDNILLPTKD